RHHIPCWPTGRVSGLSDSNSSLWNVSALVLRYLTTSPHAALQMPARRNRGRVDRQPGSDLRAPEHTSETFFLPPAPPTAFFSVVRAAVRRAAIVTVANDRLLCPRPCASRLLGLLHVPLRPYQTCLIAAVFVA